MGWSSKWENGLDQGTPLLPPRLQDLQDEGLGVPGDELHAVICFIPKRWRSLNQPLKRSLFHHTKKVTIAELPGRYPGYFSLYIQILVVRPPARGPVGEKKNPRYETELHQKAFHRSFLFIISPSKVFHGTESQQTPGPSRLRLSYDRYSGWTSGSVRSWVRSLEISWNLRF